MAFTDIDNPELFFQCKLYAGNDSGQSITLDGSEDMSPNMVWIKDRGGTDPHGLYDTVRGALKQLRVNLTNEERTHAGTVTSFDSDGFTVGNDDGTNDTGHNFVSWNWKAGTSFSNDASATSVGSIDSSGSINTTAGFSIISWTGTGSAGTIAHGLGATPEMYWVKNRDKSSQFAVFHKDIGNTHYLALNDTDASADYDGYWSDTSPTSTVFSVGSDGDVSGASNEKVISYCFRSIQGYSKIGSYTGNGNADGAFVYTGFRPAWIMIKKSSATENWSIFDTKRNVNGTTNTLPINADNSGAESGNTGKNMDILSNGVKMKTSNGELNGSGATYIYIAFAEAPLVNSNGIPNNAR